MKLEVLEKDCFYHIYNRGNNGETIFITDGNKSYFLRLMKKYFENVLSIYSYCLMDNHFHLVVQLKEEEKVVTQKLSNFFNAYAKAFNKEQNRTGSLFEKHFRRIKLNDEEYLKNLIIYIHLNPKHHLDVDFETFKFSSYASILSDKLTSLKREEVIELFDTVENFIFCHKQKAMQLSEKYTFE